MLFERRETLEIQQSILISRGKRPHAKVCIHNDSFLSMVNRRFPLEQNDSFKDRWNIFKCVSWVRNKHHQLNCDIPVRVFENELLFVQSRRIEIEFQGEFFTTMKKEKYFYSNFCMLYVHDWVVDKILSEW